jgi:hypothetical protein
MNLKSKKKNWYSYKLFQNKYGHTFKSATVHMKLETSHTNNTVFIRHWFSSILVRVSVSHKKETKP